MEKLKKVLSPGKDKDNETMYGSQETRKAENEATHSPTGINTGSAYDSSTRPTISQDGASALSMKSGVLGSSDQTTEERALRSDGITGQSSPIQSQNTSSGLGHNAALSSAGAAGVGGAYAATRSGNNDNIDDPSHTDRSFPLSGGAVVPPSSNTTTSLSYAAGPISTSDTTSRPPMTSASTGTAGGTNAVSGDAARANLGLDRFSAIDHSSHSHSFRGDPCETEPAEKTLPFVPGPHATVAANMLDPHVPGEFPREDGMDPHSGQAGHSGYELSEPLIASQPSEPTHDHNRNREAAIVGGVGVGVVGAAEIGDLNAHKKSTSSSPPLAASPLGSNSTRAEPLGSHGALTDRTVPSQQPVSSSTAINPEDEHHHGRNAALVGGGATAAGLVTYAATRDHEQQPLGSSTASSSVPQSGAYQPIAQSSPQHVSGNPLTGKLDAQPQTAGLQTTQQPPLGQEKEHHYGRNAALAGGATAATGAAGYAALDGGRGDTGPASKTIGPHDSNIANIVDPRVRPEPEKMKDHTTSGPWQSDTLNKLDPKVESDPYKAEVKEHGYATREPTLPVQLQNQQQQQAPLEQNKDHHYGRDAALVGGTGAAAYGASQLHDRREQDPLAQQQQVPLEQNKDHHYGRDAALTGGTGAGAYGASQLHDRREQDPLTQNQQQQTPLGQNKDHHYGRDAALVGGAGTAAYGASQLHDRREQDPLTQTQQQQQAPLDQTKEHHYGRDAALVGGTGAAAYGAHEVYDKHEQEKLLKEQEKQAKHDAKEHDKELKHEAKEHDKQAKHDAHEAEKARKKEEEKLAKEQEKAAKEHAKEQEKLEKHQAKEAEKAEEKRLKELEKLEKEKEKENQKLAAARADEAEAKHKEHNKLHKDPPEEREKKDGILHRIFHHKQYERERPEGRGASFDDERPKGLEYKDADEERFARQHEQLAAKRSLDGPGHAGLPATGTAGGVGAANDGIVTEPHTGLPMNVGKYGSGAGGTDGGEHIAGYGEHVAGYHAK